MLQFSHPHYLTCITVPRGRREQRPWGGSKATGGARSRGAGSCPMSGAHVQHLLAQLKFKSLKLTTNAALQRRFGSPFIFREEDPSRQVSPGRDGPGSFGAAATPRSDPAEPGATRGSCGRSPRLQSRHRGAQQGKPEQNRCARGGRLPQRPRQPRRAVPPSPPLLPARLSRPAAQYWYPDVFSSQITFEISKPEESQIPIWIILGSTLGGLLLLALLVLALWKVRDPGARAPGPASAPTSPSAPPRVTESSSDLFLAPYYFYSGPKPPGNIPLKERY